MINPSVTLARVRASTPLVHNITNYVAMQTMANVLLAIGASPAMAHAREEAAELARLASALTINIGTPSIDWLSAMGEAAHAANRAGTPWVLDPVAVGATAFRRQAARRLARLRPTVIRGNTSEIIALNAVIDDQSRTTGGGKGVDATDSIEHAEAAAQQLARSTGAIIAVTGPRDLVCDGERIAMIDNGHPLMPRVTALGCALTGVIGAFLGAEVMGTQAAPFEGTVAALAYYGLAGQQAAQQAQGPGSFAVQFLDALAAMDETTLDREARISHRSCKH
ncbi:hydroxyethylthiazole kinase [Halochromatium roseum]|uniref:hydroxyethylthiazole kinase n=1 Tax=Halochromatium roseum TaxID=391920 RepID=UPI001911CAAC|nr:hydroxyethylthiazole kinase [Halochromatium roseum]MBK5941882.1 hydroxyethylthiazole kinase [Halochromatium roseum]